MNRVAVLAIAGVAACAREREPRREASAPPGEVWISAEQANGLTIATPSVEQVESTVRTNGKIVFDEARIAHVFSAATGRVVRLFAELGARVPKGAPLAIVRSLDVGTATSDVSKAYADLVAAEHEFARKRSLFENHAASQADFDAAEDLVRKARAEQDRARQHAELLQVRSSPPRVTSDFVVTSPIAGEVIARGATPGVEVQGQYSVGGAVELFTVGDIDSVWLTADVFERDLPRVRVGARLHARSSARPQRVVSGSVDWIAPRLDAATRAARVRSRLDNPDHMLVPEMSAAVEIVTGVEDALVVPAEAVSRLGDADIVFVDRGDAPNGRRRFDAVRVEARPFEDGRRTRLLSGVAVSDRIVVRRAILLTTGS